MPPILCRRFALLLAATALAPAGQVLAAPSCGTGAGTPVAVGTVAEVPAGAARRYTVELGAGQGVIVDLAALTPPVPAAADEHDEAAPPRPRGLALCDARGKLLAPLPGEVFDKGGSLSVTPDGERLRFVSATSAQYTIVAAAGDAPRELLVRGRAAGSSQAPIVAATLGQGLGGAEQTGIVSSSAPMVFSFEAPAGQWVELKATSERDTILRLAGPDRQGEYAILAENDDSEGLNPRIRRKLPTAGTYFVQVDSLSDEPGEFLFSAARIAAPQPPPPPAALRSGGRVTGKLADADSAVLYALPVVAGHSYRLDLTAAYDGVVAIGLPNPVEPDSGGDGPDAGFAEIKSQDSGTTGTEKLSFTARSTGQLLVRVKSFGIGETDGAYTLTATDLGE